jgi:hypothetical protein
MRIHGYVDIVLGRDIVGQGCAAVSGASVGTAIAAAQAYFADWVIIASKLIRNRDDPPLGDVVGMQCDEKAAMGGKENGMANRFSPAGEVSW